MNAALRAIVKSAVHRHGIRVTGFLDGLRACSRTKRGRSGSTSLGDRRPGRHHPRGVEPGRSVPRAHGAVGSALRGPSDAALATLARHGVDGLLVIGGDGSLTIARRLEAKGIAVVGVPKTIDNDVSGTDVTLGFDSALAVATEAVDRVHTTAASHHRVMVVEVMGVTRAGSRLRRGWLAEATSS